MHTDELDWTTWSSVIASSRSKNRRAHHVPLSSLGQALIRRAPALATATIVPDDIEDPLPRLVAEYRGQVFAAIHGNGPVDRHVVTLAMNRVCDKLYIVNCTAHDLRRPGASVMESEGCGLRGEVIARILNHDPLGSPVTQIYNRYD